MEFSIVIGALKVNDNFFYFFIIFIFLNFCLFSYFFYQILFLEFSIIFDNFICFFNIFFIELRSAIANERPIIVLKDYQFEWPDDLSPDLKDIVKVINNSPQYLYIAEHFNLCLQKIKNHLGNLTIYLIINIKY